MHLSCMGLHLGAIVVLYPCGATFRPLLANRGYPCGQLALVGRALLTRGATSDGAGKFIISFVVRRLLSRITRLAGWLVFT